MEELLKLLGFTTPLIYATAAYGLFHRLDENVSDEAKAALARTMSLKGYKSEQVASALVEVFDRIYTYPLLRWRAFFRSLLFTTVVLAISVFELYRNGFLVDLDDMPLFVGYVPFAFGLFIFNVFTDYLSLFVIRPVLIRSGTKPVTGLALGTVSGAAIVLTANFLRHIGLVLWATLPDGFFLDFGFSLWVIIRTLIHAYLWAAWHVPWVPLTFAWPATVVFAWLPLFALGILIARSLTPLSWIVGRTQWFLKEGNEHPLNAIGYVAAVVVFLGTVAGRAVFSVL